MKRYLACGRCGDTERFDDGPHTVCATCGATRWQTARNAHPSSGPDLSGDTPPVSLSGPDRAGVETRSPSRSVDSAPAHRRIATYPDGSQILVTDHPDGTAEVVTRGDVAEHWSLPVKLEDAT